MSTTRRGSRHGGRRLILFGAFDRHNFGDLLLARCAAALGHAEPVFVGLGARDLESFRGYRTLSLAEAIAAYGKDEADFVHVGGELLTTTAWEAAVMLQTQADAARTLALHDRSATSRQAWAEAALGTTRRMPYVVPADALPDRWRTHFRSVGGVAFADLPKQEREDVLHALRVSSTLSVRDARTRDALRRAGLAPDLVRDPASATPTLLGESIRNRMAHGEIAALIRRMPRWVAVQLASHWGDEATLDELARSLRRSCSAPDSGIVLFRAGLAPWHDDLETLRRLASRLDTFASVTIFESAHMLDICALLAGAHAYVGTSLHGWIVAHAFGLPATCLVRGAGDKAAAYLDTWCPHPRQWRTLGHATRWPDSGPT